MNRKMMIGIFNIKHKQIMSTKYNEQYTSLKNGISKLKKRAKQIEDESEKQKKKYLEISKLVDKLSTEIKEIRQNLRSEMIAEKSESQNVENEQVRKGSTDYRFAVELDNSCLGQNDIERLGERLSLMIDMTEYAKRVNKGWVPNWEDDSRKYGVSNISGAYFPDWCCSGNGVVFVFGISVKSANLAKEMFDKFRDRIEKYH